MYPTNGPLVQEDVTRSDVTKYDTVINRLSIKNVEPSDEGAYVCTVSVDDNPSMQALGGCLVVYGEYFMS